MNGGVISFVDTAGNPTSRPRAKREIRVGDGLLLPGLVDLHAHPAGAGSRFGVDVDEYFLKRGATTVLSQGDAGARNATRFIHETIEAAQTRVRLALNFCADGEEKTGGRFFSLDEASVEEAVAAVRAWRPHTWGISLNIALIQGRDVDPMEVMRRGVAAAEEAGCPIIFGATKDTATPLAHQLALLRPGDVMTYCFHPGDGKITEGGRVLDSVWDAKERGVLFDVGDGVAAFGYDVAEDAIGEGFLPDSLSSDFFRWRLDEGIMLDMPLVASKLAAVGMSPGQCWPRMTSIPAGALGLSGEVGVLAAGGAADFCVLELAEEAEMLVDGLGQGRLARRWSPTLVVKGGKAVGDGRE